MSKSGHTTALARAAIVPASDSASCHAISDIGAELTINARKNQEPAQALLREPPVQVQ